MELVSRWKESHLVVLCFGCCYTRWPLEAPTSTTTLLTHVGMSRRWKPFIWNICAGAGMLLAHLWLLSADQCWKMCRRARIATVSCSLLLVVMAASSAGKVHCALLTAKGRRHDLSYVLFYGIYWNECSVDFVNEIPSIYIFGVHQLSLHESKCFIIFL